MLVSPYCIYYLITLTISNSSICVWVTHNMNSAVGCSPPRRIKLSFHRPDHPPSAQHTRPSAHPHQPASPASLSDSQASSPRSAPTARSTDLPLAIMRHVPRPLLPPSHPNAVLTFSAVLRSPGLLHCFQPLWLSKRFEFTMHQL